MNNKRQETLKNASLSHRESMKKSLNARLEAARAKGNDKLVKQLEAEAKYLHLQTIVKTIEVKNTYTTIYN